MVDRVRSRDRWTKPGERLVGGASSVTAGKLAAETWLRTRVLDAPALTPWHVEAALGVGDAPVIAELDAATETRFRIEIYSQEWGFFFCHQGAASWIRVTDIPFVHGRDDFSLLATTPALKDIGSLLRSLERRFEIELDRRCAHVRTNLQNAEPTIRQWILSL